MQFGRFFCQITGQFQYLILEHVNAKMEIIKWNLPVPNQSDFPFESFFAIGFSHHRTILSKEKDKAERFCYIRKCAEEKYSRAKTESSWFGNAFSEDICILRFVGMMMEYRLDELFDLQMGKTPARNKPEYWNSADNKWISIGDLSKCGKYITDTKEYLSDTAVEESGISLIPENTVVMSFKLSIGKTAITSEPMYSNEAIMSFRDKHVVPILPDYLYYMFLAKDWDEGTNKAVMGKTLNKATLAKIIIDVHSLAEQKKIVDALDNVASIIDARQQQLSALDDLIKARFVEMFGDPVTNPKGWETYHLNDCLERIDNGKSFVCSDKPRSGDYPAVLKLSAATYGDYRPEENKALLDENRFVEGAEVHPGDLLFTRKNTPELVGMAAYVQETPKKLMMPDLIFRLVTNDRMNPVFLWQLINCKEFRPIIQGISGGSAKSMSNISKERLGKINVICPPRQIQDQLVPFVHQVDKSKDAVKKSLAETQLLFDSLMQQYFG